MRTNTRLLLVTLLFAFGCGASGEKATPPSGAGGSATGGATSGGTTTAAGGTGGIVLPPPGGTLPDSPFFSSGNAPSVDLTDPCNTAYPWVDNSGAFVAPDKLDPDDYVTYQGKLWQYKGTTSENWMVGGCGPAAQTPQGCDRWVWVEVKTCP